MVYEFVELDVWGNEDSGFDVNDFFHTGTYIDVEEMESNDSILDKIREFYNLPDDAVIFCRDEYRIEIEKESNVEPLLSLEKYNKGVYKK